MRLAYQTRSVLRESERKDANTRRKIAQKRKRGEGGEVKIGDPVVLIVIQKNARRFSFAKTRRCQER